MRRDSECAWPTTRRTRGSGSSDSQPVASESARTIADETSGITADRSHDACGHFAAGFLASEARKHVRQLATVCGRVVATGCEQLTGRALLHLDRVATSHGFQVALGGEKGSEHSFEIASRYFHRGVCATGTIEKLSGRTLYGFGRDGARIRAALGCRRLAAL